MANLLGAKTEQNNPYRAEDLLLKFVIDGEQKPLQTVSQIKDAFLAMAHAHNALLEEKKRLARRGVTRGQKRTSSVGKRDSKT